MTYEEYLNEQVKRKYTSYQASTIDEIVYALGKLGVSVEKAREIILSVLEENV